MHRITELRQQRAALVLRVRQELDTVQGVATAQELDAIKILESQIELLDANIDLAERQQRREAELASVPANCISTTGLWTAP